MKARIFQHRVWEWLQYCFGPEVAADKIERHHRFMEESIELVQACGCSKEEVLELVEYVYNRPVGEKEQEVGGVMITLSALCQTHVINMEMEGEKELLRIWESIPQIRAKQKTKPNLNPGEE